VCVCVGGGGGDREFCVPGSAGNTGLVLCRIAVPKDQQVLLVVSLDMRKRLGNLKSSQHIPEDQYLEHSNIVTAVRAHVLYCDSGTCTCSVL